MTTPPLNQAPSRRDRAIVAAIIAGVVATLAPITDAGGDFMQLWAGARALLVGQDPYAAVGPDSPIRWPWPLYYPVPALLPAVPFTLLSLGVARVVWVSTLWGVFAYAVTAQGWWGLLACLHLSFLVAGQVGQLVVLLAVGLLIPAFGGVAAGKPTTGLATILGAADRRSALTMIVGAFALLLLSFVFDPGWVPRWLESVRHRPHRRAAAG